MKPLDKHNCADNICITLGDLEKTKKKTTTTKKERKRRRKRKRREQNE